MSQSVSQMLIRRMCRTSLIIFFAKDVARKQCYSVLYFSFLGAIHSVFIRSGSIKQEFASVSFFFSAVFFFSLYFLLLFFFFETVFPI